MATHRRYFSHETLHRADWNASVLILHLLYYGLHLEDEMEVKVDPDGSTYILIDQNLSRRSKLIKKVKIYQDRCEVDQIRQQNIAFSDAIQFYWTQLRQLDR